MTTGKAIWVYVIVRLCVSFCSNYCRESISNTNETTETTKTSLSSYCCTFITNLGLCIYGGIVLFNDDVCDSYKRTGLYKMYNVLYWFDVVGIVVIFTSVIVPLVGKLE